MRIFNLIIGWFKKPVHLCPHCKGITDHDHIRGECRKVKDKRKVRNAVLKWVVPLTTLFIFVYVFSIQQLRIEQLHSLNSYANMHLVEDDYSFKILYHDTKIVLNDQEERMRIKQVQRFDIDYNEMARLYPLEP